MRFVASCRKEVVLPVKTAVWRIVWMGFAVVIEQPVPDLHLSTAGETAFQSELVKCFRGR